MFARSFAVTAAALAICLGPGIAQAATPSTTITVNSSVGQPVFSPDGSTAYVPNTGSGSISVIDVASATMTRTIAIPSATSAGWGMGISPDGTRLYATDNLSNKLHILDAATGAAIGSPISVGNRPAALAVSPDGSTAFLANWSGPANGNLSFINSATGAVTNWFDQQVRALAVSPDGLYLYATVEYDKDVNNAALGQNSELVRIRVSDRTILGRIPTGRGPNSVAVTPDGATIIVGNTDVDSLTFIRTADWSTSSMSVGDEPYGISITSDGATAYVSNHRSGTVDVVDIATRTVTATVAATPNPWVSAISPVGTRLYVASMSGPKVFTFEIISGGSGGSSGSGAGTFASGPRGAMQQFAVPSGTAQDQCAALAPPHVDWVGLEAQRQTGWGLSYAEWPHEGTGGFVCSRVVRLMGTSWSVT